MSSSISIYWVDQALKGQANRIRRRRNIEVGKRESCSNAKSSIPPRRTSSTIEVLSNDFKYGGNSRADKVGCVFRDISIPSCTMSIALSWAADRSEPFGAPATRLFDARAAQKAQNIAFIKRCPSRHTPFFLSDSITLSPRLTVLVPLIRLITHHTNTCHASNITHRIFQLLSLAPQSLSPFIPQIETVNCRARSAHIPLPRA